MWKSELSEFPLIVDLAQRVMGLTPRKNAASSDRAICSNVLRVEITRPRQPHLMLVDLPGLFYSSTKKADCSRRCGSHRSHAKAYIGKPDSIILAAIFAKNDFAN